MIILVFGLPGSWKSRTSQLIQKQLKNPFVEILRTDAIRKELFPVPTYSLEESLSMLEELYQRLERLVWNDWIAVVDGVFAKKIERERIRAIAQKYQIPCLSILVTVNESVIKQRLEKRMNDISDADYSVYLKLKASFQDPTEESFTEIENSGSENALELNIRKLLAEKIINPV